MCEPAIAATRQLFPRADITLLVKPAVADLFRAHPGIDHLLVYEDPGAHTSWLGKWSLARTLRARAFDMAILFQNAFEAGLLAFLAGIPQSYGYATDGRRLLLSDAIRVPAQPALPHQVEYYVRLLAPLGLGAPARAPRLYLSEQEKQAMDVKLEEQGIGKTDFLIGLNPGSTYGGAKRWLPERFAEAADRLVRTHEAERGNRAHVVIVGAKGEEPVGDAIAGLMQSKALRLAGRTSVRELMALIKRCGLFLTNDTGPMHIAAAFGVPVVAVFGPTDWRRTSPFRQDDSIVRSPVDCAPCLLRECPIDHRCMTRVTVDEVFNAAVGQLQADKLAGNKLTSKSAPQLPACQPARLSAPLKGIPVFLDRDGTVNRDSGYVKAPEELEVFPGSAEAISRLNKAGAIVILTTNQSGIGRGMFSDEDLARVHAHLHDVLREGGAALDGLYYCPHHPNAGCACRKPGAGMIDRAAEELGVTPSRGYVIGDKALDIELAKTVGAGSILVTTGPTSLDAREQLAAKGVVPDFIAPSLAGAVDWIFADARARGLVSR